jgi:hypothetical protein
MVPHRRALVGGVSFALCLLSLRVLVVGWYYSWRAVGYQVTVGLPTTLWLFVGAVALGTLSVSLFLKHGLVSPGLLVLVASTVGTVHTWHRYQQLAGAAPGPAFGALAALLFYWVVPATVAVLLGGVERFGRGRLRTPSD